VLQQLRQLAVTVCQTAANIKQALVGPDGFLWVSVCLLCYVQAWQTVAAEYYDPQGQFSQAQWASQLLAVLKAHGGTLHTQADTYQALTELVGSLGDKYSTFLDPSVSSRAGLVVQMCSKGTQNRTTW
jgi:hypothetical protein